MIDTWILLRYEVFICPFVSYLLCAAPLATVGLAVGGTWGLYEGVRRPDGKTMKLRMNGVLNGVTRRGPFTGNSLGVLGEWMSVYVFVCVIHMSSCIIYLSSICHNMSCICHSYVTMCHLSVIHMSPFVSYLSSMHDLYIHIRVYYPHVISIRHPCSPNVHIVGAYIVQSDEKGGQHREQSDGCQPYRRDV